MDIDPCGYALLIKRREKEEEEEEKGRETGERHFYACIHTTPSARHVHRPSSSCTLNGCKRAHPPAGLCDARVAHLSRLHAHQACVTLVHGPRYLPDKYLHMGLQGNFLKTHHPRFLDQIPLSRPSYIGTLWCMYNPFRSKCAPGDRIIGGEGGGDVGVLAKENLIFEGGMVFEILLKLMRVERGLIAQMGKI